MSIPIATVQEGENLQIAGAPVVEPGTHHTAKGRFRAIKHEGRDVPALFISAYRRCRLKEFTGRETRTSHPAAASVLNHRRRRCDGLVLLGVRTGKNALLACAIVSYVSWMGAPQAILAARPRFNRPPSRGRTVPRPVDVWHSSPIDPRPGPDHRPTLTEVTAAIDEQSARLGGFRR
jgi:hypothetical protein